MSYNSFSVDNQWVYDEKVSKSLERKKNMYFKSFPHTITLKISKIKKVWNKEFIVLPLLLPQKSLSCEMRKTQSQDEEADLLILLFSYTENLMKTIGPVTAQGTHYIVEWGWLKKMEGMRAQISTCDLILITF